MKNVRLKLVVLIAVLVFFTACQKESFDFGNKIEDSEFVDEIGTDDNDNDGSDQEDDTDTYGGGEEKDGTLTTYRVEGDNIIKIKDHAVSDDLLSFQQDKQAHQEIWSYYTRLIPAEYRNKITEFLVFYGQEADGYVVPIDGTGLRKWAMGLSIELVEDLNDINLVEGVAYLIIHEVGHVLTLNDKQVAADDDHNCATFHTGEGCSFRASYINAFYELGWKDIYQEYADIQTEAEGEAFYNKYQDRFVTNYASTNPGEDIAEVFAFFVTQDEQPSGTSIADQKIRLMYNYPELVELRNSIREDPVLRAMQPGSWKRVACKHKHGEKHQQLGHSL